MGLYDNDFVDDYQIGSSRGDLGLFGTVAAMVAGFILIGLVGQCRESNCDSKCSGLDYPGSYVASKYGEGHACWCLDEEGSPHAPRKPHARFEDDALQAPRR